jgi:hypothetical protein
MNIKIRLEPKIEFFETQLVQKLKKQVSEEIAPVEKTLEEALFGKEIKLDEPISEY